ncbi:hypothetical protein EDC01DRAFT_638631 [Geopyxis carbonaria]|nr:hypothetical protein EDC01DRAFT_638631 [Geopyxis carbonaria]
MAPLIAQKKQLLSAHTQLSYNLPHTRIHCCQSYPRLTPTSPEIVVYGHQNGLTILYGRDFTSSYSIHLGNPVLSLSFPPSPLLTSDTSAPSAARTLLSTHLVLAATCRDRNIHVITLPLSPPAASAKDVHSILSLGIGASTHQTTPTAVAITLLPSLTETATDDLVLASTAVNELLLWRIPVPTAALPKPKRSPKPWLRLHTHTPAATLHFNPCATSLTRRHQLLLTEDCGAARIYDLREKRWSVSMHVPVHRIGGVRKRILAADWCVGGFGAIALLEDGEWGVWDLESCLHKSYTAEDGASLAGFLFGGVVGEDFASLASASRPSKRRKRDTDDPTSPGSSVAGGSFMSVATDTTYASRTTFATAFTGAASAERASAAVPTGSLAVHPLHSTSLFPHSSFLRGDAALRDMNRTRPEPTPDVDDEAFVLQFGSSLLLIRSLRAFWKGEHGSRKRRGGAGSSTTASENSESIVVRNVDVGGGRMESVGFLDCTTDAETVRVVMGCGVRIGGVDIKVPV